MTERRRPSRPRLQLRRGRARAAVYVEVLLAILPVLLFFFGLLQLALLQAGRLVVQHAAQRAARSAVVVLEDDPQRFGGEPQGQVVYHAAAGEGTGGQELPARQLAGVLGAAVPAELQALVASAAGARLAAIQRAAYQPLAALAPAPETLQRSLGLDPGAFAGAGNLARFLLGSLLYSRGAAAVTLRKPDGSVAHCVGPTDDVTVRVTYLYTCTMPLVSALMCSTLEELSGLALLDAATLSHYRSQGQRGLDGSRGSSRQLQSDLQRAGDAAGGLSSDLHYAASPELLLPLLASRAHFRLLSAEATLPNQGAHYYERAPCPGASEALAERRATP